jgi:hypothetical protein
MDIKKNWLIRTHDMQILGPVSHKKIDELIQNGSLDPKDEVCSGNGYWFYVKEKDLVQKFIHGNEKQGFNPISEARDVLDIMNKAKIEKDQKIIEEPKEMKEIKEVKMDVKEREESKLPSQDDLDYPDMATIRTLPTKDSGEKEQEQLEKSSPTLVVSEQLLKKLQR